MCTNEHPYGGAAASHTIRTTFGVFHVCGECASGARVGGELRVIGPLQSDNPRQRCQCENEIHADPAGARR